MSNDPIPAVIKTLIPGIELHPIRNPESDNYEVVLSKRFKIRTPKAHLPVDVQLKDIDRQLREALRPLVDAMITGDEYREIREQMKERTAKRLREQAIQLLNKHPALAGLVHSVAWWIENDMQGDIGA